MELAAAPAAPETLQPPQPDYEASKPRKEDYTDNKEYRRDYKRWHTFKTRDQEYSAVVALRKAATSWWAPLAVT